LYKITISVTSLFQISVTNTNI